MLKFKQWTWPCRRGAKEVAGLLEELKAAAERMCRANDAHMEREESSVLPVLEASLCAAEQRAMVWRTLRAMPLRLLERMLPWLAGVSLLPFLILVLAHEWFVHQVTTSYILLLSVCDCGGYWFVDYTDLSLKQAPCAWKCC